MLVLHSTVATINCKTTAWQIVVDKSICGEKGADFHDVVDIYTNGHRGEMDKSTKYSKPMAA